jgi:hypothetical protein
VKLAEQLARFALSRNMVPVHRSFVNPSTGTFVSPPANRKNAIHLDSPITLVFGALDKAGEKRKGAVRRRTKGVRTPGVIANAMLFDGVLGHLSLTVVHRQVPWRTTSPICHNQYS